MKQKNKEQFNNRAGRHSPDMPIDASTLQITEHFSDASSNPVVFMDVVPENSNGLRIGAAMNAGQQKYNEQYIQWMQESVTNGRPDQPDNIADMMNMFYNMIKLDATKNAQNFDRPAAYVMDNNGNLIYSASSNSEAIGMVLARQDGSLEHLGADEKMRTGVISDLKPEDKLYLASNKAIETVKQVAGEHSDSVAALLESVMEDDTYPVDLVCVNFNHIGSRNGIKPSKADEFEARRVRNIRALGLPDDATPKQISDAKEARNAARQHSSASGSTAAHQAHVTGDSDTDSLPDSDLTQAFARGIQDRLDAEQARVEDAKTLELEREHLAILRSDMAEVAAKCQGRLFSFDKSKHAELEAAYDRQLRRLGKLECAELLDDETKSDDEKNTGVIAFIFDEQQKLREATTEVLKGSKISAMIKWVNEGTKTQRLLKGVAVGAGGVLVGAGVGAVVGAAAGVGLAAAAAATATSLTRFGRYYAKEDNKQGRGMNTALEQEHSDAAKRTLEQPGGDNKDKFATASTYFKELFEADTKKEQEKRRKSARRAIGGVALGMVVGGTAAYAIGELADGAVGNWANRMIDTPEVLAQTADAAPESDVPPATIDGPEANQPDITPEHTPTPVHEFSLSAKTIGIGEGWLQTFNDMGISSPTEQYALLNNHALMQELANQGLAYPDAAIGGWGINMTADGNMPIESLKVIEDYAKRSGYSLAS